MSKRFFPRDWGPDELQHRKGLWFLFGTEAVLFAVFALTIPVSGSLPGESGVILCPLCFLIAIPLHFLARPLPGFRPAAILLEAVGTAFSIACYNTEKELSPAPADLLLACAVPAACLLVYYLPDKQRHRRVAVVFRTLSELALLGYLIFTIVLWCRETTVFASSGCFAAVIAIMDVFIHRMRRENPESPFALLSCAGFGAFLLVGVVVIVLLAAAAGGDADCDCDGCGDCCDCGDCGIGEIRQRKK